MRDTVGELNRSLENLCSYVIESNGKLRVLSIRQQYLESLEKGGKIQDVLANYTCYQSYYELVRTSEQDPDLPRRQAAKAIARFVELHPHNIA